MTMRDGSIASAMTMPSDDSAYRQQDLHDAAVIPRG